ncbi:2TM domain-containing protein [Flavobacterium covae]
MDVNQYELYEYARLRIKQKKRLYIHFVIWFTVSLFLLFISYILNTFSNPNKVFWIIVIWTFFLVLHFIRVFITERFMNKKWERE